MEWEGARDFQRLAEVLKLDFASVLLRDSHSNILEEAINGICSLVHTFADFLRIRLTQVAACSKSYSDDLRAEDECVEAGHGLRLRPPWSSDSDGAPTISVRLTPRKKSV